MKVIRFLDKYFEELLSATLLAVMTVIVTLQIILRLAHAPLAWSEEAARYLFIWLIYIAGAYAIKKRSHIKVEVVTLLMKEKGKYILDLIADIGFFLFAAVISYYGWIATYKIAFVNVQESPSMHLNMGIPYLSVCLGCTLMAIRLIQDIVIRTRAYKTEKLAAATKEVE